MLTDSDRQPEHQDAPSCWLCLAGEEAGPLSLPCRCPSLWSHPKCLGRWQLQSAGKAEERSCRFCEGKLPNWSGSLLDAAAAQHRQAVPIMAVVFNGRLVKLPCMPGKDGAELFKKQIREIFGLDESVSLDVTFELKVPGSENQNAGQKVYLKGFHTFDAASTVAAICAAKRMARKHASSPGNVSLPGEPSTSAGAASSSSSNSSHDVSMPTGASVVPAAPAAAPQPPPTPSVAAALAPRRISADAVVPPATATAVAAAAAAVAVDFLASCPCAAAAAPAPPAPVPIRAPPSSSSPAILAAPGGSRVGTSPPSPTMSEQQQQQQQQLSRSASGATTLASCTSFGALPCVSVCGTPLPAAAAASASTLEGQASAVTSQASEAGGQAGTWAAGGSKAAAKTAPAQALKQKSLGVEIARRFKLLLNLGSSSKAPRS